MCLMRRVLTSLVLSRRTSHRLHCGLMPSFAYGCGAARSATARFPQCPKGNTKRARRVPWYPTQAKTGLEWGTQFFGSSQDEGAQLAAAVRLIRMLVLLPG